MMDTLFELPKVISERDKSRAIKLATDCIRREIQRLSVSANLHEIQEMDWPSAVGASKRRKELREAVDILEAL